jgi:hypothetical protein
MWLVMKPRFETEKVLSINLCQTQKLLDLQHKVFNIVFQSGFGDRGAQKCVADLPFICYTQLKFNRPITLTPTVCYSFGGSGKGRCIHFYGILTHLRNGSFVEVE